MNEVIEALLKRFFPDCAPVWGKTEVGKLYVGLTDGKHCYYERDEEIRAEPGPWWLFHLGWAVTNTKLGRYDPAAVMAEKRRIDALWAREPA